MSLAVKAARASAMGDPGLFGFIGDVARKATGVVGGLGIPGVSTISRIANTALGGGTPKTTGAAATGAQFRVPSIIPMRPPMRPGGSMTGVNVGGPRGITIGRRNLGPSVEVGRTDRTSFDASLNLNGAGMELACPKGFKPNKTSYMTQNGFVPAGTKCVRIRKRNPFNARANSRAMSRLVGAKRSQKQLQRVSIRPACPAKRSTSKKSN